MSKNRCAWGEHPSMLAYHDTEWGRPARDDATLYEMLLLEAFQAGLSWRTILNKREAFREAFDGFDPQRVAAYDETKIQALLQNAGIIRSRGKIEGAIRNAQVFLEIQREFGSFSAYLWGYAEGLPVVNQTDAFATTSPLSDAMSADLRKRGMRYMGSVTLYSYLQAVGVVNDHETGCFCHDECVRLAEKG